MSISVQGLSALPPSSRLTLWEASMSDPGETTNIVSSFTLSIVVEHVRVLHTRSFYGHHSHIHDSTHQVFLESLKYQFRGSKLRININNLQ